MSFFLIKTLFYYMFTSMKDLNQNKTLSHEGFNAELIRLRYAKLQKYYNGQTCLELGSADGEGTKMLVPFFERIVAVDGSDEAIQWAKNFVNSQKVEFICSYFENLQLSEKFDTVMLTHILEHVDNPIEVLKIAKKFLKDDGILIADVPNATSLHRELWVMLDMIPTIYSLNSADISIWHQRVYDINTFTHDIEASGLKIIEKGWLFIKIFSNKQLEDMNLSPQVLQWLTDLWIVHPELSAEIFCICKK